MKKKTTVIAALLGLLLIPVFFGCLEAVSYQLIKGQGWFESWEYLTVKDETLGFRLRPHTRMRWSKVDVSINRSGVRDISPEGEVAPRGDEQLLIVAAGDSNTFGAYTGYEASFPALLQQGLSRKLPGRTRVVNLGVSGYSTLQARLNLQKWMHLKPDVVVFTECFNDRSKARPDGRGVFAREYRWIRPYEFGDSIIYSVLLMHKIILLGLAGADLPDLDGPLPQVRLSLPRFRRNLEAIIDLARGSGAEVIFVATGDDAEVDGLARTGISYLRNEQWGAAEKLFGKLINLRPNWFLNWYHFHYAYRKLQKASAHNVVRAYRKTVEPGYLNLFSHYSNEYVDEMQSVAEARSVPLLDMRNAFARTRVRFLDVSHFGKRGHRQIASALRRKIVALANNDKL